MAYKETRRRTLLKTTTWRVSATGTTMALVYIFTGKFTIAFSVGILETVLKTLLFYVHERAWNSVSYGRESQS